MSNISVSNCPLTNLTPNNYDTGKTLTAADFENENLKEDTLFHDEYKIRILGQFLIFLSAIPLNGLVIYSFLGKKAEPTRVNYLAGHLCSINLAHTLFSIPFDVIWHLTGIGALIRVLLYCFLCANNETLF